jgi:hypothetical protein
MRVAGIEDGLDRVDRAGTDVTEDHAKRANHYARTQRLPTIHVHIVAECALVRRASRRLCATKRAVAIFSTGGAAASASRPIGS